MSADSFTAGPWKLQKTASTQYHIIGGEGAGECLATVWKPRHEQTIANARLMAAAPDLLKAIKEAMEWIDNWSPNFTEDDEWPQAKSAILAAIAKAEGRQP